ncbi:N-acetylmuramoyl-L-alanine amidase [Actinacidiphila rubida]|uniref:N-acetylmuramoyl-L-alanine amidase n=2 Tax=Actinacidiphila rubida TaxID=310780 RepID=A0A1H8H3F4_9ACTN|nr:N-acetylmuramoyl-L-alanine amidase [Actinacidiphila rubida]SEN50008.1 N-acetylmuramoyl-L-alanine amidase [Actinacidiphila rubida]
MHRPFTPRRTLTMAAALSLLAGLSVTAAGTVTARADDPQHTRQAEFASAAAEFGVPQAVLEAVSYNETRWEAHAGQENSEAGYGPMNLTDLTSQDLDADGLTTQSPRYADLLKAPAEHTAAAAAALIGADVSAVTSDEAQNIRAGAALLASYARGYGHGKLPRDVDGWYAAAARYGQPTENKVAQTFADVVWDTLRTGASRTTQDGQQIALPATARLHPNRDDVRLLGLKDVTPPASSTKPECPKSLDCDFIPGAYTLLDPADKADYGSHDLADRPHDLQIRYITLHTTDETYDGTLDLFNDPTYAAGAHYVVRSQDGHVTQMIPTKDIAWDSGNRSFYQHSIGIEQESWSTHGGTWFSENLYRSTASLVKYLATTYDIPLDRAHILGHDNVPGTTEGGVATQHWDPGPGWDWEHFFDLLGAPIHATAPQGSDVVAIKPGFRTNLQTTTYCDDVQGYKQFPNPYRSFDCPVTSPSAPSSFVPLYTAPSTSAPLASDPYLHKDGSAGTNAMNDWGDKAPAGEQYVVADRKPGWTAIWWAGKEVWLQDSPQHPVTVPVKAMRIVPKAGRTSVPVYTTAYPEASVYPADFVAFEGGTPRAQVARSLYSIPAGQSYVAAGPAVNTDSYFAIYYDGSAPYDQHDFVGQTKVYEIVYNHRMAFVNADDVDLVQQ